jgi:hypothetical protein
MNRDTESIQADSRRGRCNCMIKLEDTQYASEPRNEFGEDWNSYAPARWNIKEVLGTSKVWVDGFEYNWLA